MTTTSRRRSKAVVKSLGLTLAAAYALTGCGAQHDYQGICVDPQSQQRLPDGSCDNVHGYYNGTGYGPYWFYMSPGSHAPAVGQRYNSSTGVYKAPSGKTVTKGGVPNTGGKVSRGGFGSSFGKSSS